MNRTGSEERELDKLRRTIEEFRAKAERGGNLPEPRSPNTPPNSDMGGYPEGGSWGAQSAFSAPALSSGRHFDALSPNSAKRVSSGSLSSMSSHASHSSVSSSSSASSAESDQRQSKKKRWLPLKSAFTRGGKSPHPSFTDPDEPLSPTRRDPSLSYHEILQVVQEKERKLTDVRLEALTSQHQLHQLQDQIVQMQHEMQLLRLENQRLQACSTNYVTPDLSMTSDPRLKLSPITSLPPPTGIPASGSSDEVTSSLFKSVLPDLDCSKLHRLVSPGREEQGHQMRFVVRSPTIVDAPPQYRPPEETLIGSVPISRRTTWEELDRVTSDIFAEYCRGLDGDSRLGLTSSSISFYKVGDQTRVPGSKPPELLPCAFIVGSVDAVEISLKDASCGSLDLMTFNCLIPREILHRYVITVTQKKFAVLHGPSGTGKSSLAYSLANHLVARERRKSSTPLFVYDVKQSGEENLQSYLKSVAEKCSEAEPDLAHVIIVENCYMLTSLGETLAPLMAKSSEKKCPYVIGTMLQGKAVQAPHSDIAWISCATNSHHVREYLARHLRRCVIANEASGEQTSEDEFQNMLRVITWLPLCWHHVNRCLEAQSAGDVTIGARAFATCPPDFFASCSWFVQVWNHVIAPYVIAAVRRIRQSQSSEVKRPKWADPTEWVIESFPWTASDLGGDNSLRLKRISGDDLDCPPVPPRTDLPKKGNPRQYPSHTMTFSNPNYIESCRPEGDFPRKYSTGGRVDPPVPPMELMGLKEASSAPSVWHRHNSPMTSPTKTIIHAGVSKSVRR